jgi:hypothetical protein
MKIKLLFLLILFATFSNAQTDVFQLARNGSQKELEQAFNENPKMIQQLNDEGYTILILACYNNNSIATRFLIENGADLNGESKMGTPIMAAVVKNNKECINLLLENNVDVTKADANGSTALHYAIMFKHYDLIPLLLKKGADKNQMDNRNLSSLDYAKMSKDEKLINLLK